MEPLSSYITSPLACKYFNYTKLHRKFNISYCYFELFILGITDSSDVRLRDFYGRNKIPLLRLMCEQDSISKFDNEYLVNMLDLAMAGFDKEFTFNEISSACKVIATPDPDKPLVMVREIALKERHGAYSIIFSQESYYFKVIEDLFAFINKYVSSRSQPVKGRLALTTNNYKLNIDYDESINNLETFSHIKTLDELVEKFNDSNFNDYLFERNVKTNCEHIEGKEYLLKYSIYNSMRNTIDMSKTEIIKLHEEDDE